MTARNIDGLEIDQDLAHQRREWRLQRIGWAAMALLLVAALAGLLGSGPASRTSAGAAGGLQLEYNRFSREQSRERMRITIPAALTRDGVVRLHLDRRFVEAIEIHDIYPEPESVSTGPDAFTYELKTAPGGAAVTAMLVYEAESFGPLDIRAWTDGTAPVTARQWVYP